MARGAATLRHQSTGTARSRILLVDDEESIRKLLSRMLEASYDVETAADGEAAIRLLREPDAHYDLLISDLNMPDMDGLTLIREAQLINPTLAAIVITGYSTESSAIEALNLGVTGYLTKPFGTTQVLAAAAKALERTTRVIQLSDSRNPSATASCSIT